MIAFKGIKKFIEQFVQGLPFGLHKHRDILLEDLDGDGIIVDFQNLSPLLS